MNVVLRTLILLDIVFFVIGTTLGVLLDSAESVGRHFLIGLGIAIFTVFIHCLILFYLIGTGMDIREAVEDIPEIRPKYVEFTRSQKRRAFPSACLGIVTIVFAALMGGEVHSRLIGEALGNSLPLRDVSFWWFHVVCVAVAIATSLYAFWVETEVVRNNRRAIDEINDFLGEGRDTDRPGSGGPGSDGASVGEPAARNAAGSGPGDG